jgi:hypothetical protein
MDDSSTRIMKKGEWQKYYELLELTARLYLPTMATGSFTIIDSIGVEKGQALWHCDYGRLSRILQR